MTEHPIMPILLKLFTRKNGLQTFKRIKTPGARPLFLP